MDDYSELLELAQDAGLVDWKWWTSNSALRLTTEREGRHGADGDAISAYRDNVQCPEAYRAFIEKASPAAVGEMATRNKELAGEIVAVEFQKKILGEALKKDRAEIDRLRTAEGDAMTYKAGMENVAQQRDQLKAEVERLSLHSHCHLLRAQAVEVERDQLKAEVERLRGDIETWRLSIQAERRVHDVIKAALEAELVRLQGPDFAEELAQLRKDAERYRWLRTQNIPLNGHDFLSSHEILDRRVDDKIAAGAEK